MITLHHCPESRSMKSLWLLYELKLDFDVVTHSFGRDLRAPDYLAVHPLGRVPCLIDGKTTLFESGAITEWLCQKYDSTHEFWRKPDSDERFEWLQWIHYSETIAVHCANLTQQFIALNDASLQSATVVKLEKRRLEKAIEVIDQKLNDHPYILKSGFSAADINIGYALHVGRLFTDISEFQHIADYYNRLSKRDAFTQSLPEKNDPKRIYLKDRYRL
ncbi:glutathione S-transferase family protein [Kordiimonas pumila]|uniref:Glutathione S-transferase family protein n=1 Tax=Kordiimonas pumila TaxID=2161677 RepID=A0ABV7D5I0_9PROT|nr:glutathione S-transferase family protein [Kordiimonas pumila]